MTYCVTIPPTGTRSQSMNQLALSLTVITGAESPPEEITVTVLQKGKPEVSLKAASGTNLRNLLTDNDINVYQSVTRWTNCKGKQLCG